MSGKPTRAACARDTLRGMRQEWVGLHNRHLDALADMERAVTAAELDDARSRSLAARSALDKWAAAFADACARLAQARRGEVRAAGAA